MLSGLFLYRLISERGPAAVGAPIRRNECFKTEQALAPAALKFLTKLAIFAYAAAIILNELRRDNRPALERIQRGVIH